MDPRIWVDQLYTYGPYAVLALFVFWVAPKQLQAFRQRTSGDRVQRAVSGIVALGCWLVVFLMVFYVWRYWPPRTVYLGSLGTHRAEAQFFPQSPHLFVSSRPVAGSNRLHWDYVIVTETSRLAGDETFSFTYQWGQRAQDYTDFAFPAGLLQKRRIDLTPAPEQPGTLLYDDDGDPLTPPRPYPRFARAGAPPAAADDDALIGRAHAQPGAAVDKSVLLAWLASPNANLRAQARAQLRQLSPEELRQLLQSPGLADVAREQIEAEQRRRR